MPSRAGGSFDELMTFKRFRLNVIGFLRLPHDVSESALRDAIKSSSPNLLASYKDRAARARSMSRFRSSIPAADASELERRSTQRPAKNRAGASRR
ncbi:MAG: hypothetical protein ABSH33_09135 [Steroidobacteraceae bacterium]